MFIPVTEAIRIFKYFFVSQHNYSVRHDTKQIQYETNIGKGQMESQ